MNLNKRKSDFVQLGIVLEGFLKERKKENPEFKEYVKTLNELNERIESTIHFNAWFTRESIESAIQGIVYMLKEESFSKWIESYPGLENDKQAKNIGLVMAGNIPLVGFHDLLCVVISGNKATCKLSSSDDRLWPCIIDLIYEINADYKNRIVVVHNLKEIDAVIATGSNNTARYFDYYFKKYPHIIRKNRNSIAVLNGEESKEELERLGADVFSFFGLGCRNVSKIYLPKEMDLDRVIEGFFPFQEVIQHNKYANNFDYNKTVMLLNQDDILENGFMIFKQTKEIVSPLACLFYEYYDNYDELKEELNSREEEIQCIVGKDFIDFGGAQNPELWDYADGVDTMDFLLKL